MVLDYSQRRQVSINRPRKKSSVFYVFFGLGIVLAIYSLGILSGWFLYKASNKSPATANPPVAETAPKQRTAAHNPPSGGAKSSTAAPESKITEPPLTFYYTLPKGGSTSLGSGINTLHGEKTATAKSVSPSPTTSVQTTRDRQQQLMPTKIEPNEKPTRRPTENTSDEQPAKSAPATSVKPTVAIKPDSSRARYTVQVASYQNKKEAEELKSALDRKGLLANVIESRVPGKGTYYRVRLGTNLDLETANKIASRAGKGAIVTPE
jgi:cell division protein FtsN